MRLTRGMLFLTVSLSCLLMGPAAPWAQEAPRLVRVGIFPLEPVNFVDEEGQARGFYVDLVEEVGRHESWRIDFVTGSWADALQRGIDGDLDLVTSIIQTPERDKVLDFSRETVMTVWGQIFVKPGSPVESILDLAGLKVAIMEDDLNGANFLETLEKFGMSCTPVEVPSHHDVFRLVQAGEVAAGVAPNIFGYGHVESYDLLPTSILFHPESIVFATARGRNADLLNTMDRHLAVWKADRTSFYYERLDYWFGGSRYEAIGLPLWLRWSLGAAGLILLILALGNWILKHQVNTRTAELKANEAKTRAIFDQTYQLIGVLDPAGTLLDVNRTALDFVGVELDAVVGRPFWECPWWSHSADEQEFIRRGIKVAAAGEIFQDTTIHPDQKGTLHYIDFTLRPIFNDQGQVVQLIPEGRDITSAHKANRQLARLGMAIDHATDVIIIMDMDGVIEYVNPAFSKVTGYGQAAALGRNIDFLDSGLQDNRFHDELWLDLRLGKVWHGLVSNRRQDGNVYQVDMTISPILGEDGRPIALVCIQRDLTEIQRLERELRQAQKLEAIGTLAGGIAHDFNNILTAIVGYNELAVMDAKGQPELLENLESVAVATDRARILVQQILTFSRHTEVKKVIVKPALILGEALKLLRSSIPTTIEFRDNIVSQGKVLADPTQIHQILMNLATNAFHAMEENGGVLGISLTDARIRAEDPMLGCEVPPGDYILLEVSDTGHGMDAITKEKIFEPYFTSKKAGKGTGLGLAVVHGIVRSFSGHVTVYSEPGQGTSFHVYLPVVEGEGARLTDSREIADSPRGGEHILFVDDEIPLVKLAAKYFGAMGYRVTALSSSNKALAAFREDPDRFDILVTDQTMPGLTGVELAAAVHELRPGFPVILCTGFSRVVGRETATDNGITRYVQKPVVMSRLAHNVRQVFDS